MFTAWAPPQRRGCNAHDVSLRSVRAGERRVERHYGSLQVIARCVGMYEVPYSWGGGLPFGHEPFFEFLALAEDAGTDWPPVVDPSHRLVFFDQALAGTGLPQGRSKIGAARNDLITVMRGFASLMQG